MAIHHPHAPLTFLSLGQAAEVEVSIEKSRFLGYIQTVTSVDQAQDRLRELRQEHPQATHVVPAWVIGPGGLEMRTSDDGEPHGTAGPPMLEILKRENITDCLLVAVRYFGGIKLGTGGLTRAYRQVAKESLEAAGIATWVKSRRLYLTIPYPLQGLFEHRLSESPWLLEETRYDVAVHHHLIVPAEQAEAIQDQLIDWSHGQGEVTLGELLYQPIEKASRS